MAVKTYKITERLTNEEKFGLNEQMRRCLFSVSSYISEGTAKLTSNDKAHFMTMSYGSSLELLNQAIISKELNFISDDDYLHLRAEIESMTNKINALRNHFLNS